MEIGYYAIFDYEEIDEYGISIYFPDIPECLSCSKTLEEGLLMAKEALALCTYDILVHKLPKQTDMKNIKLKNNEKAYYISYKTEDINLNDFMVKE